MLPLKRRRSILMTGLVTLACASARAAVDGAELKNVSISSCGKSACFVIESPRAAQGVLGSAILSPVKLSLYPPQSQLAVGKRQKALEVIEGDEGFYDTVLESLVIKKPKIDGTPSAYKEVMLDFKEGSLLRF